MKRCKKLSSCNLTVGTNSKKQLDLALFLSHIEKFLSNDLTSTEIEERLLQYRTIKITYNNRKIKEISKVIEKGKLKVMWVFTLIEIKIVFLLLDLTYFILILFVWGLKLRSTNFPTFSSDATDQGFYIAWTLSDSL